MNDLVDRMQFEKKNDQQSSLSNYEQGYSLNWYGMEWALLSEMAAIGE